MQHFRLSLFAVTIGSLLVAPFAHAAGFQFYELGAPVNGTAGVGQATITTDASTSYYNPAAMSQLPYTQFMLGAQSTLSYNNFSPSSANTIHGNNGSNAGGLLPGTDAYLVYRGLPNISIGVSLTTPYGGALSYDNHWVGRYNVQQMMFYTLNLNPSIAYQVNNWFTMGAGVAIEYANLYQTVALPVTRLFDGQATVKADNTSPGFNLGVLFTPYEATKIGFAYRSQIIHNLSGNVDFANLSITPGVRTKLVSPANIIASVSQGVTSHLNLLGEVGWANWSSMVNNTVYIASFAAVTPQNWHDTYRLGVGAQYRFTPAFMLQAGTSFDSSPTSSSKRLPNLPMDRQIRVGFGMEYALMQAATLGVSYEYLNLGKASISNNSSSGTLVGSYSRNYANVFQASLNVAC